MIKSPYIPLFCLMCINSNYVYSMNKKTRAATQDKPSTSNTQQQSAATVQVLSGRVVGSDGSSIFAVGDLPAPAQPEPIQEFTKNLAVKLQENAKAFTEVYNKLKSKQATEAQELLQKTKASYETNVNSYFEQFNWKVVEEDPTITDMSKVTKLNTTEQVHISNLVLDIEKQVEKIDQELARTKK